MEPTYRGKDIEKFSVPKITFVREMTEPPGRHAASQFKPVLEFTPGVHRAYLVWCKYGDEEGLKPVLAIIADSSRIGEIVIVVSHVSKNQFPRGSGFYIDVMFPAGKEVEEVASVARPFVEVKA